jgi:hypothetical protein
VKLPPARLATRTLSVKTGGVSARVTVQIRSQPGELQPDEIDSAATSLADGIFEALSKARYINAPLSKIEVTRR